jgi:hypothetical protein
MTKEEFIGDVKFHLHYADIAQEAIDHGHKHWIEDTIPVDHRLAKFYNEFKFKRRNIIPTMFAESKTPVHLPDDGVRYDVYSSVGVTFKDSPEYRVGTLRMGVNSNNDPMYEVESALIKNEKFAEYSEGYNIKRTKNFAAAVKTAVTYVKPMTMDRVRNIESQNVNRAKAWLKAPAEKELHDISTVERSSVLSELAHMMATGYTPVTAEFANALKVMVDRGAELRRLENYTPRECWVWGQRGGAVTYQFANEEVCAVQSISDVPEFIRDKIAVLQIAEKKQAIMDVGVKISDNVYCVFV